MRRGEYRKFRIRGKMQDDFAAMHEVVLRRYQRILAEGGPFPDLILIDGGKGQLAAAADVMREMGAKDVPVVGLAKQHEEIFVQDVTDPVILPRHSQALYLVQRLRDEAHRFAITYHRGVRARVGMQSVLDSITGVGPKRKKALIRKFGSLRGVRDASVDEIAATVGFTRRLADTVKAALT